MQKVLILFISLFVVWGCSNDTTQDSVDPFKGLSVNERKKAMEGALKRSSRKEQLQIESYLKRHEINAEKSGTGVHYLVYKKGEGASIKEGMFVSVSYDITNLKGDTLYSVLKSKPEEFQVEQSEKESGLHEVIKKMKDGDHAIVVIPSYRAHGISGDEDKIPPLTSVVYNLHIQAVR